MPIRRTSSRISAGGFRELDRARDHRRLSPGSLAERAQGGLRVDDHPVRGRSIAGRPSLAALPRHVVGARGVAQMPDQRALARRAAGRAVEPALQGVGVDEVGPKPPQAPAEPERVARRPEGARSGPSPPAGPARAPSPARASPGEGPRSRSPPPQAEPPAGPPHRGSRAHPRSVSARISPQEGKLATGQPRDVIQIDHPRFP